MSVSVCVCMLVCVWHLTHALVAGRRVAFFLDDVDAASLAALRAASNGDEDQAPVSKEDEDGGDDGEVEGEGGREGGDGEADGDADGAEGGEKAAGGGGRVRRAKVGDEVQFCILSEARSRMVRAVDIKVLPKGTVQFEQVRPPHLTCAHSRGLRVAGSGRARLAAVLWSLVCVCFYVSVRVRVCMHVCVSVSLSSCPPSHRRSLTCHELGPVARTCR